jgi:hypothetical protein
MGEQLTKENTMKRIALALLATAAVGLGANAARADTRFSVGVNYGSPVYAPPAVVYAPPAVVYAPARAHGYFKDVTVKTWVPERWVNSRDRWGRPVRVCEPGYFTYRTDRVWVDGRSERDHDNRYGYENRGYGYDNHGHDNRGGWNR